VWRWDQQEPFGNNVADENPNGLGAFDLPLRLPGQYFDKETNLTLMTRSLASRNMPPSLAWSTRATPETPLDS
jgi:hypothetical protein